MVKALVSSDLHLSNKLPHARPSANGRTDRFDDQLALLEQMSQIAEERKVDIALLLGDIFDQSLVDAVTLTHSVAGVVKFPCPVYILPGNHDAVNIRGGRFTVEAFGAMGRDHIHYIGAPEPLAFGNVVFWPCAYAPAADTKATLAAMRARLDKSKTNVLLFHNSVLGCKHIGWTCDDGLEPEEVCEGFDWVLSGHFHDTQRFGPDGIGMYMGAPMHHHFGDVGRPAGFWVFNFNDKIKGKRSEEWIESNAPKFHTFDRLDAKVSVNTGDYVRFKVSATSADWAAVLPQAKALVSALSMKGIRADFKHDPIYHHEARMRMPSAKAGKAKMTLDRAIADYVGMDGVVVGGLDPERLKAIGREALAAVRSRHGTTD